MMLKSGTVKDDPKVLSVRLLQEELHRLPLKQRNLQAADQHIRQINQRLRGKRVAQFMRPSSIELMEQAAKDATAALGVEITRAQVARWRTAFRKTKGTLRLRKRRKTKGDKMTSLGGLRRV